MIARKAVWAACVAIAILCSFCLAACGSGGSGSAKSASQSKQGSATSVEEVSGEAVKESSVCAEIDQIMADIQANSYDSVAFSMETRTTATGSEQGKVVQQGVLTTMDGELSLKSDDPRMHFAYEMKSSQQAATVAYEMFINKEKVFIKQDDRLYMNGMEDVTPEKYISSVTDVASKDKVDKLLDIANSCKIERNDDGTIITITANAKKVAETGLIDTSSLPPHTEIATLVANYVISPDNRLTAVRFMSSTSGTPTYRVNQSYSFSQYNEAKLPDWPSMTDLVASDPRVETDENGNMYLIGEDGGKYQIESVDEDGTVHFLGGQGGGGESYGYAETTGGGGGGGTGGGGGGGGGGTGGGGGGGGPTGMGEPQVTGDGKTGMGEPRIQEE